MKRYFVFAVILAVLAVSGCVSETGVRRMDSGTQTDLSGFWNDTDVKIVCKSLIDDCLTNANVNNAIRAKRGTTPKVIVGNFRNESSEHIDTSIITTIMEEAIFNSGKLGFVAGDAVREALRNERYDQQSNATEETAARLGKEIGADFMLTGTVKAIVDKAGNRTVRTYFVTARMTSIETNELMWMKTDNQIKKEIVRPKNKL